MIQIEIEGQPVQWLKKVATALAADRRNLMKSVAGIMLYAVERNFDEQGRPRWVDLQQGTKDARAKEGKWPGKILQRSGQLAASITQHWDDDQALVGTNKVYAAIQNFGGRTRAHIIVPKNKKALAFGGIVCRWVYHPGSNIPARPFLVLTPEDEEDIVDAAQRHLMKAFQALGDRIAPSLPM